MRRKMVESAKESIRQNASNSEVYGKMQAVFIEMENSQVILPPVSTNLRKKHVFFESLLQQHFFLFEMVITILSRKLFTLS